ncbi:techylectin-5A [Nephila pilipes]|uniref:Techylectin-5A n=1 Tax=Nephila pilipes TaxID=299642 RepID=A0A8X6TXE1_NEPPI|nr:techylectin-5A [Nephila pilipes]
MDCEDLLRSGHKECGVYTVWLRNRVTGERPLNVFCDMETDGGGWTVIQRRGDYGRPFDFFFEDWERYKSGFGDIKEDFWLGNDNIFVLTNQRLYSVRFDLWSVDGRKVHALYDTFWIDDEDHKYALHINGYSGDAGDSLFPDHDNRSFTTKDQDNDANVKENCAVSYRGAWCNQVSLVSERDQSKTLGIAATKEKEDVAIKVKKDLKDPRLAAAKERLISWFKERRKSGSTIEKWGSQLHRIAVALYLADESIFSPGNSTGQEISYELTIQLLRCLSKDKKFKAFLPFWTIDVIFDRRTLRCWLCSFSGACLSLRPNPDDERILMICRRSLRGVSSGMALSITPGQQPVVQVASDASIPQKDLILTAVLTMDSIKSLAKQSFLPNDASTSQSKDMIFQNSLDQKRMNPSCGFVGPLHHRPAVPDCTTSLRSF